MSDYGPDRAIPAAVEPVPVVLLVSGDIAAGRGMGMFLSARRMDIICRSRCHRRGNMGVVVGDGGGGIVIIGMRVILFVILILIGVIGVIVIDTMGLVKTMR